MAENVFSSQTSRKRARYGFRYQMELKFDTEDAKKVLVARIDGAKRCLAAKGSLPLDNKDLLSCFLDMALAGSTVPVDAGDGEDAHTTTTQPMLKNSGMCNC